jgi:hypothetical protein
MMRGGSLIPRSGGYAGHVWVVLASGVEGVVEDVAMLHVVEIDDDKPCRERARSLVLRDAMSTRCHNGETGRESCR